MSRVFSWVCSSSSNSFYTRTFGYGPVQQLSSLMFGLVPFLYHLPLLRYHRWCFVSSLFLFIDPLVILGVIFRCFPYRTQNCLVVLRSGYVSACSLYYCASSRVLKIVVVAEDFIIYSSLV